MAGGFPLEFPTMSLGETIMRPTTMLYRNLMAMEVEESLRANPLDGVVLLSGMRQDDAGAADGGGQRRPAGHHGHRRAHAERQVPGPRHRVGDGACGSSPRSTGPGDQRRRPDRGRDVHVAERRPLHDHGDGVDHGLSGRGPRDAASRARPPSRPSTPAGWWWPRDRESGSWPWCGEGLRPSAILTRPAFENAIRVNAALGGSTNAIVHLLAIAGRVGVPLDLADFDALTSDVPVLVNLMPSGRFLMEDFFYAGGLPAVMAELGGLLAPRPRDGDGRTGGENIAGAACWNRDVIATLEAALPAGRVGDGGAAGQPVSRRRRAQGLGRIGPSPRHEGPALVFDRIEDYLRVCDDADLPVTQRHRPRRAGGRAQGLSGLSRGGQRAHAPGRCWRRG